MNNNVFSGLEHLGFNDLTELKIYNKKTEPQEEKEPTLKKSFLYNKKVICPVCTNNFYVKAVKSSAYRLKKKDTDFFMHYSLINPYFYDVWLCDSCGYASLKVDFSKIKEFQKELILKKIKPRWHSREYPDEYNVNIAIERYKLALLNYTIIDGKPSQKAMTCLKIAWMYRLLNEEENELMFLKQALIGFNRAYHSDNFPIYGMGKFTMMYLMGELNRRIGNDEKSLFWFSHVITSPNVSSKLKDLARDQRDLIKEKNKINDQNQDDSLDIEKESKPKKKKGFLSKLFNI